MPQAPERFFIRRGLIGALIATALSAPALAARQRVVTILGDSITAGLGLTANEALPAQLGRALAKLGAPAIVRGAGVSGDTAADGLARLDFSVQPDTDVCLVALGGNDLLQGQDPAATRTNLLAIVRRLKSRRIGVVLAGLSVPPAVGGGYARDFAAIFPAIARAERVPLYLDLLAGVGPKLRQADGLHPDAAGVAVMAAGLAPLVVRVLKARR
jgi:acyl-CoA thioesterase-1